MNISIDFDETYTRDMPLWNRFIVTAIEAGHTVRCVTMRSPNIPFEYSYVENTIGKIIGVENLYFTSRKAKKPFMNNLGINIDVWIDDNPFWIYNDAR